MKKLTCHCGGVEIQVKLPETGFEKLMRCNCSLCKRRGYIMTPISPENFKLIKGQDLLTLYQYHTKVAEHYFCSKCGIYTHSNPRSNHDKVYMLNVACIEGVKPFDLENIVIMQNFLGGVDEDWFIMIHVAIEYEAKEILSNLKSYFLEEKLDQSYLLNSLESIQKINSIMNRMPEKCDPFIYYNRVRPYIFGWKNNPATPDGVIYEGVEQFSGEPQLFRGETGAQSSIVPALDALLGITHSNDPLREYLDEMRLYMPKEHRDLLNGLDKWSEKDRRKLDIDEESIKSINDLIKEVHIFRNKHLEYARVYIYEQSLTNNSNSNIVGTGGTPFMKYLDKHLQETVPTND